jgi:hypothetical protein
MDTALAAMRLTFEQTEVFQDEDVQFVDDEVGRLTTGTAAALRHEIAATETVLAARLQAMEALITQHPSLLTEHQPLLSRLAAKDAELMDSVERMRAQLESVEAQ